MPKFLALLLIVACGPTELPPPEIDAGAPDAGPAKRDAGHVFVYLGCKASFTTCLSQCPSCPPQVGYMSCLKLLGDCDEACGAGHADCCSKYSAIKPADKCE